jgi:hypothetical protein
MRKYFTIVFIFLFIFKIKAETGRIGTNTYNEGQQIEVIVDKVWPKGNPSETYNYFSLPFCPPKEEAYVPQGFAYTISGSRKTVSEYDIRFKSKYKNKTIALKENESLCGMKMKTRAQIKKFRKAIKHEYLFLMHIDDLPIRFPIGRIIKGHGDSVIYELYTNLDFIFLYNGEQVS